MILNWTILLNAKEKMQLFHKTILIMLMLVKSNTNALKAIMLPMKTIVKYCLKTQKDCHKPDLNVLMDSCTMIILMGMSI